MSLISFFNARPNLFPHGSQTVQNEQHMSEVINWELIRIPTYATVRNTFLFYNLLLLHRMKLITFWEPISPGAILHGDGRIFSFIDLMRWPHDSNLTLNVLLQIFVVLSEVLELRDQLSLKTDDFVFIKHVKIDNPGSYCYNISPF